MLKFLVLGDFHYKKNMYASTLAHLETILQRAKIENVDFVIHTGDFCNDYQGSPELMQAYLNNPYNLPVFGIYGNHELETKGNTMPFVSTKLSNRNVTFAGPELGYWYYDYKGYRIIGLDTNYSYNTTSYRWEHNLPASWGAPAENERKDSLSPAQIQWLNQVIGQASGDKRKVIVFSHTGLSGEWASSPDAQEVRNIFKKYPGTVILSVNGHLHTDHFCVKENVAYFDVNVVMSGYWQPHNDFHYADEHYFTREKFDNTGLIIGTEDVPLNALSQSKNTWFFTEPLSAVVAIQDNGDIDIKGAKTGWKYDVLPPCQISCVKPEIPDYTASINL